MSDERFAELRRYVRPCDCGPGEYCGNDFGVLPKTEADELFAEVNRLKAALADLRDEWGTRWEGHERVQSFGYGPDAETLARENTHPRDTVVRRTVGEWRAAERQPDNGSER